MTSSSDNPTKTVLLAEDKTSIIEHLNEEHQNELISFAQLYLPKSTPSKTLPVEQALITQIYHQGMDVQVEMTDNEPMTIFIPFPQIITRIDELQHQYIALKQRADKQLGKDSIKVTEQIFEVQSKYRVSDNMLRLVLSTDEGVLRYRQSPGYAYLFDLTTNASLEQKLSRHHCYYTLRKVIASREHQVNPERVTVWVDVYLHEDKTQNALTSGGLWASGLRVGDQVRSKREFPERVEHLHEGQTLLIADETSLPTVARLLEIWTNPLPPIVISITNESKDQEYLKDAQISKAAQDLTILPLVTGGNQERLAEKIEGVVADFLSDKALSARSVKIDKVWGALEAKTTKKLRRLLTTRLALTRTDCILKVYWRAD